MTPPAHIDARVRKFVTKTCGKGERLEAYTLGVWTKRPLPVPIAWYARIVLFMHRARFLIVTNDRVIVAANNFVLPGPTRVLASAPRAEASLELVREGGLFTRFSLTIGRAPARAYCAHFRFDPVTVMEALFTEEQWSTLP